MGVKPIFVHRTKKFNHLNCSNKPEQQGVPPVSSERVVIWWQQNAALQQAGAVRAEL